MQGLAVLLVGFALAVSQPARATDGRAAFGGPDAVPNQLAEDEREGAPLFELGFLAPYRAWKERVREKTGLHFGGDYSSQSLFATESPGKAQAASGMLRFFGTWDLVDRGGDHPGALVWKVEHRHRYTDVPPSALGFELGYVGLLSPPFSNQRWRATNFYWRQRFAKGRFAVVAGFLDATDYVDVYALASPWTGFSNLTFSTGSASIALPNDAALGIAAAGMLTDHLYAIASLSDANGDPRHPWEGFETFFEDREFFKSFEIGWVSAHERFAVDNVHATFWHVDGRDEADTPAGWGVNVSASWAFGRFAPFLRAGWSEDGGALLDRSVGIGFSFEAVSGRDQLGVAANYGRPSKDTFGPGLGGQWSFEAFYRWQLLRELALTPSVQLLVDPALGGDTTWVFGLRLRYAL